MMGDMVQRAEVGIGAEAKAARAMSEQDYDASPPRCVTCVYYRREPQLRYVERRMKNRKGYRTQQVRNMAHPIRNPLVDRCTFGNFIVRPSAVCDEWRNHEGERITNPATPEQHGGSEA